MKVFLPDGKGFELESGATALDLAKSVSIGLYKAAVAAKINGILVDLASVLAENDTVEIITFDSDEGRSVFWHSSSHLMA